MGGACAAGGESAGAAEAGKAPSEPQDIPKPTHASPHPLLAPVPRSFGGECYRMGRYRTRRPPLVNARLARALAAELAVELAPPAVRLATAKRLQELLTGEDSRHHATQFLGAGGADGLSGGGDV